MLERTAQIMGLLTLKETAVAEAEERVSGEPPTELLVSAAPVTPHCGLAPRPAARLDRVDTALGEHWRTPERALQLHVALRLHALRTANDPV